MIFQGVAQIKINSGQRSMSFLLGIFIAFVIADCCTYNFHNGATEFDLFGSDHEIFHHKVISWGEKEFGVGLYFKRFKYMKGSVLNQASSFPPSWLCSKPTYGQCMALVGCPICFN